MSDAAPTPPDAALAFGANAFATRVGATEAEMADLHRFHDLLTDWSGRMNLIGPSALSQFWLRHAYDSAQLLHVEHQALRWADIGAGAGFPGVVLAILLRRRAGGQVDLIDSVGKRIRFLEAVATELHLPVRLHHARAESLIPPPGLQVVTARACAPLSKLLGFSERFFRAGARGLFLKGREVEAELDAARQGWRFQAELLPSLSDPSGRIVRIERLSRA